MRLEKVSLQDTHSFSPFFLDYISQKDSLKPFYNHYPVVKNFEAQLKEKKSFSSSHRDVLVKTLQEQYQNCPATDLVKQNIVSLADENTFTITTGHQLNLFTGPLYFIYKIVTVINTCQQLKEAYPKFNFVPVYWMASEDHDFAEISYFYLFGKKYSWQTEQKGAVGRFETKSIKELLKEVPGNIPVFPNSYTNYKTLADAARHYVNELFGQRGIVVVDADQRSFKQQFKNVIEDDLFKNTPFSLVEKTNTELEAKGYKTQVHARPINLFYLDKGLRARIEKTTDGFTVVDTDIRFSDSEARFLIETEPEKFSPNVILRPVYQEAILPNLAYIGGPAEVVYWLQLKDVFKHFSIPFPVLMPRNFALIVDAPTGRKLAKTGLACKDLFEEKHQIFNKWVAKNTTHNISAADSRASSTKLFELLTAKAAPLDATLVPMVAAEAHRVIRQLDKIESRMLRAEKRLHIDKLKQIEAVRDVLFPGGSLQERHDNFLNFYIQDPEFIQTLIKSFDPFDFQLTTLTYDDKERDS